MARGGRKLQYWSLSQEIAWNIAMCANDLRFCAIIAIKEKNKHSVAFITLTYNTTLLEIRLKIVRFNSNFNVADRVCPMKNV